MTILKRPRYAILLMICVFTAVQPGAAQTGSPEYHWPTDAGKVLTSSFAESRSHRFHGGIDFKTWGQVGYKVFAVRPGYVSRVELSPYGYGRCLLLKLDTGETALYGHLQKFSGAVESHVRQQQEEKGAWSIELDFSEDQFPVAQGDVIAYTGQSGVGAPHLHFELLDNEGRPFNPLLRGYQIADTTPPTIRRVMILPLEAHSRVNGDLAPLIIPAKRLAPGRFVIDQPIEVIGRIAFAVNLFDEMDGAPNDIGTYINRLRIDGEELFHARYDWFPYELNHQSDLDRDYRALVQGKGYFHRLYRDIGNELPFYGSPESLYGVLECAPAESDRDWLRGLSYALGIYWDLPGSVHVLEAGEHRFEIETVDFAGNSAVVSGSFRAGLHAPTWKKGTAAVAGRQRFDMEIDYFDTYARVNLQAPPDRTGLSGIMAIYADGYHEQLPVQQSGASLWRAGLPLYSNRPGPVRLQVIEETDGKRAIVYEAQASYITVRANREKSVTTSDRFCQIDFSDKSLFKSLFVRARTLNRTPDGWPVVGSLYEIEPEDVPLQRSISVKLQYPPGETQLQQLAVYARQPREDWEFVGNNLDQANGWVSGRTRSLGTFALLRDAEPPLLEIVAPGPKTPLQDRRPLLKARILDKLSGLGDETCWSMELDGKKVIAEYDYEAKMLFYRPLQALAPGRHEMTVTVRDRCGNETRRTHGFAIK